MSSFSLSTAARVINQLEDAIQALPLQNTIKLSVFLPDAGRDLHDDSDKLEDELVQLEQYSKELGRTQTAAMRAALDCGFTALLVEKYALESTIERLSNLLSVDEDGRCEPNVMHSVMLSTQKRFEHGSSSEPTVRVSIVHEQLAKRIRDRLCAGQQRLDEIKTKIYELGATTIVEIPDL